MKVLDTLLFFRTHYGKVTNVEIKDFILKTWGEEIYQGLKHGSVELENYLSFLNIPHDQRSWWIERIKKFVKALRDGKK